MNNEIARKKALARARADLAEKVSIAGLKEAFQEHVLWIRRIYQLAVVVFVCFIMEKTYRLMADWMRSGYKNEATDFADLTYLPVSNVTFCAQVYFNETFIKENLTIPENVMTQIAKTGQSMDDFYEQLTLFVSLLVRPRHFSPLSLKYFNKILYENKQTYDFSAFAVAALPTCESMLKRCWFDGKEFDCCQRAVQSIDDDGICYLLNLNFDSDNAFPMTKTVKQTKPGPKGGLTVEISLDAKDFPWLEGDVDNGFKIVVGPAPYVATEAPLNSPSGAETFIRVKAEKRLLSKNCAAHNQLSTADSMFYHDPQGAGCMFEKTLNLFMNYSSCHFPWYTYRPNVTLVCTPMWTFIGSFVIFSANLELDFKKFVDGRSSHAQITKLMRGAEDGLKKSFSEKGRCQRHCRYWQYSSSSSFIYLEKTIDVNGSTNRVMFSRIHVYYSDLDYRQYKEVEEMGVYLVFCEISNVAMLYLGMSVVSFFDFSFYFRRYLCALWRLRRGDKNKDTNIKRVQIRNNKVHPI